jgi:hypothetical protein
MSVYTATNSPNYSNVIVGGSLTATTANHNSVITVANGTGATWANNTKMITQGEIHLEGDTADLVINGVRLSDTLKAINDRLSILQINPELHSKYDNLRQAYEHYKTLEKLLTEYNHEDDK